MSLCSPAYNTSIRCAYCFLCRCRMAIFPKVRGGRALLNLAARAASRTISEPSATSRSFAWVRLLLEFVSTGYSCFPPRGSETSAVRRGTVRQQEWHTRRTEGFGFSKKCLVRTVCCLGLGQVEFASRVENPDSGRFLLLRHVLAFSHSRHVKPPRRQYSMQSAAYFRLRLCVGMGIPPCVTSTDTGSSGMSHHYIERSAFGDSASRGQTSLRETGEIRRSTFVCGDFLGPADG